MHHECVNIDGREYGMLHRKHDGNSVCWLALFVVIAPLTVNNSDYLLAFNRLRLTENLKPSLVDGFHTYTPLRS